MDYKKNDSVKSTELKAGNRTYFFDVKETRSGEYYLVITESKKAKEGQSRNERHRMFLYREDMEGFLSNLKDATSMILGNQPLKEEERRVFRNAKYDEKLGTSNVNFEDL